LCGHYGTSFINYPVQHRGERGWLPACGSNNMSVRLYVRTVYHLLIPLILLVPTASLSSSSYPASIFFIPTSSLSSPSHPFVILHVHSSSFSFLSHFVTHPHPSFLSPPHPSCPLLILLFTSSFFHPSYDPNPCKTKPSSSF
jgi:hypothetical protein